MTPSIKILVFGAARPNLIKVSALLRAAADNAEIEAVWVYATQHRDPAMSSALMSELDLPEPLVWLDIEAGLSREALIGAVQAQLSPVLRQYRPDYLLVPGDVNAALGAALAAKDTGTRLVHVEAGLRSGDLEMPEEQNRISIDRISDLYMVTEPSGIQHLAAEGLDIQQAHLVGNVMIDTLLQQLPATEKWPLLVTAPFVLATFHRPSNVDTRAALQQLFLVLEAICPLAPVILPLHPRTADRLSAFGLKNTWAALPNLYLCPPMSYVSFIRHLSAAALVMTDSGGLQEESTVLGTPCVTFRRNTERPITVSEGTNILLSDLNPARAAALVGEALAGKWKKSRIPAQWDGRAAARVLSILEKDKNQLHGS